MDIGRAVPAWLNEWLPQLAQSFEVMGEVSWRFEYEYAGSMPPQPRDPPQDEDWCHVTMFPMPVMHGEHGELVPDARVDVLAIQEMMDDVEEISLATNGSVRITGKKNGTMVSVNVSCFPPEDVEPSGSVSFETKK